MKRNRLAIAVLTVGTLHSGVVSALGLGELALDSTLNQPFRAEIPLRDIGELDVDQIKVQLADSAAFENAGVDRSQFLSSLEFKVELLSGGSGRIVVTTSKAVVEPYLDFIVEARWPSGKMIREYTVLLDLPVYADEGASQAVSPSSAAPGSSQSPVRQPAAPVNTSQSELGGSIGAVDRAPPVPRNLENQQILPESDKPNEYRVQNHDTMWRLANKLRPSSYVTTQQTMLALLKKNPQAFVNGNVNQIKSGYILRLPSEAEVLAIDHNQAVEEIKLQAKEWRGDKVARPSNTKPAAEKTPTAVPSSTSTAAPMAPQLDATAKSDAPDASVADKAVKFSLGSAGDAESGDDSDAFRKQLREEQEKLEKTKLENSAMQNRVVEMEKQIQTLQSLIALKNSQLAALQNGQQLPDASSSNATDGAEDGVEKPEIAGSSTVATGDTSPANAIEDASKDASAEKSDPVKPATVTKPATVDTPSESAQSWIQQNLVVFVGVLLALLALLVLFIRRRRSSGDEDDLANFDAGSADDGQGESPVMFASDSDLDFDAGESKFDAPENEDDAEVVFSADDFDFENMSGDVESSTDDVVLADDSVFDGQVESAGDGSEQDNAAVTPQTGDVVAEAEIYVAYGRYDQAASLLNTAIAQDPENSELRLKLIDIYLDTRDQGNFETAYRGLLALDDEAAVARVKESMSAIEGVSDWLGDEQPGVSDDTVNVDRPAVASEDLDFSLDEVDTDVLAIDDEELDFELDDALIDSPESSEDTVALVGKDEGIGAGTRDDSISDADTLESLDVDLADLDFDFEGDFGVESSEQPAEVEGESPLSINAETPAVEKVDDALSVLDGDAEAFSQVVSDLDEGEELDFSLDDIENISSAVSDAEDNDLEKVEVDLPLDIAEITNLSDEAEDEVISFDEDDIASFDLAGDVESDESVISNDTQAAPDISADDDLDLELENIEFESSGLGDTEIGELSAFNEEAEALKPETVDEPNASPESSDEEVIDLDLSDLDMDAPDVAQAASSVATGDADSGADEIELDLADFDMPGDLASPEIGVSDTEESEIDESFFLSDEDGAATDELTLDDEGLAEGDEPLEAEVVKVADAGANSGEAISVEDLVFDEFDAGEDDNEGFDSLVDSESVATKLDLARAYIDMGDSEGAREMLEEVLQEGDIQQQSDAQSLLDNIG